MIDEKILNEKTEKYLVCFNDQCARHEHCLRWMVRLFVPKERMTVAIEEVIW